MARVLYLSYDGALDPLGRAQVVPYLEGLAARGHSLHLLTFEKPRRRADRSGREAMERRLAEAGVVWHPLTYHRRPPVLSTARDLTAGYRAARRIVEEESIEVLHARSYPPALLARLTGARHRIPWIFDMRGLYPEERVDGGLWRRGGMLYRAAKRVERDLLREAAVVVALTRASLPAVRDAAGHGSDPRIEVIPTCVDLDRFRPREPAPDPRGPFTLAYFGSVGTWYLVEEMLAFARMVLEEAARDATGGGRLLFLTNDDPDEVRRRAAAAGFPGDALEVRSVPHEEVPGALAPALASFFFVRSGPSRTGFHQTKLGESLALGIPVAANAGMGDTDAVLLENGVGVIVRGYGDEELRRRARELVALARSPGIRRRCREVAEARYDLADGVAAYDRIYRVLATPPGSPAEGPP